MLQIVFREFGYRTSFQIALPDLFLVNTQLAPDTIGPNTGIFRRFDFRTSIQIILL